MYNTLDMPPDRSPKQRIIDYYRGRESLWGYPLVLGGAKHLGYYPPQVQGLSMRQALRIMEDVMGRTVGLPSGSRVLDAGSGMGRVATYLAKHFGYRVEGIDLLDFNVLEAKRYAAKYGVNGLTNFQVGDYTELPFENNSLDAVYTIETFVHTPDVMGSHREFLRVLKPGGKLVHFEYSITPLQEMTQEARASYHDVIEGSAMHALPHLVHGSYPGHLAAAGFEGVVVADVTDRIAPIWRRFNQLATLPYSVLIRTNVPRHKYANTIAAVEWYRHWQHFRYNIVTARRPT
jgi:SAM-dependent methyltransferase